MVPAYGTKAYLEGQVEARPGVREAFNRLGGALTTLRNELGNQGKFGGPKQKAAAAAIERLNKEFEEAFRLFLQAYK